jgi:NitT/TauT family transport system substrate-binding protein
MCGLSIGSPHRGNDLMRRTRNSLLAGLGALLALTALPARAADAPVRFVLDWAFQGPQGIWALAADRGCFARAGIALTMDRGFGSGDSVAKVATGTYDIGFADFNTVIQFDGKNPDNRVIGFFMVYDNSPTSALAYKSSGITKPADFAGKTMAAPPGDASRLLFPIFAKANGLDPAKVTWINTSPELRETMLVRKQVDGISGHVFTSLMALRAAGVKDQDLVIMRYPEYGADLFGSTLLAKSSWADAHAKEVTAFARCTAEGIRAVATDRAAAIASLKKRDPLINEQVERDRLDLALDAAIMTPNVKANGISHVARDRLERTTAQAAQALDIPAPPLDALWTDKFMPEKAELKAQ